MHAAVALHVLAVGMAGPLLGVIKALTSYISGEMHDTAELGALESECHADRQTG